MTDKERSQKDLVNKVRNEYSELSFTAKFLEKLASNQEEFMMAYKLIKDCECEERGHRS